MTMDERDRSDLEAKGYKPFEVRECKPSDKSSVNKAARQGFPSLWYIEGSRSECAVGGRWLDCYVDLRGNSFVVWLPPDDPAWGISRIKTEGCPAGYKRSSKVARHEFDRWLNQLNA